MGNTGPWPAIGVHVDGPDASDSLRVSDGYFWLEAGESRRLSVAVMPNIEGRTHAPAAVRVAAWNAAPSAAGP